MHHIDLVELSQIAECLLYFCLCWKCYIKGENKEWLKMHYIFRAHDQMKHFIGYPVFTQFLFSFKVSYFSLHFIVCLLWPTVMCFTVKVSLLICIFFHACFNDHHYNFQQHYLKKFDFQINYWHNWNIV